MQCPQCGRSHIIVYSTIPHPSGIRRLRECRDCGYKFNTLERCMQREVRAMSKTINQTQTDQ